MMRDAHKHDADHDVVQEYAETLGGTQEERYSMLVAALKEAKAGLCRSRNPLFTFLSAYLVSFCSALAGRFGRSCLPAKGCMLQASAALDSLIQARYSAFILLERPMRVLRRAGSLTASRQQGSHRWKSL